jgi:hypothetical protein
MSVKRTSDEEVAVFKKRCEELFEKEARCPDCQKAKLEDKGTPRPGVCRAHQRVRANMAFDGPNWRRRS